jgi:hypothetical protein
MYTTCDIHAHPIFMLWDGDKVNMTLLISGGDVRQGCEASDWAADYSAYGNRIVEDLELLGVYRRNSHKIRKHKSRV